MGKRKGRSSAETSKESSPFETDSDNSRTGHGKKFKSSKSPPKTSAELCSEFGINDAELEYTDADYQNLTTFSLFVRMVRPQISTCNPKIPASKMTAILEAKWREFRDSKVDFDNKKVREALEAEEGEEDEDTEEEEQNGDANGGEDQGDEDQGEEEEQDDEEEEEEDSVRDSSSEEEEEIVKPKSKSKKRLSNLPLRIKMPTPVRKSVRERKERKKSKGITDKEFARLLGDDAASVESSASDDRPKRKSKKKKDSDEDFYSDDFENLRKRKPAKKRRKEQKDMESFSSTEVSSEEESEDSDDDEPHRSKKRKKPKETKGKPVIPGERRSERSKKPNSKPAPSEMTDREFEKLLKKEEKEIQVKKEKAKQRAKMRKKEAKRKAMQEKRKGDWQESGDGGNESDHYWYCEVCRDGGDLLLCDTCPRAFHKECIKIEIVPEGEWSCPKCKGEHLEGLDDSSEEDEKHERTCKVCKEDGNMLLCDFCPLVYHPLCLNPALEEIPEGEWKCPRCVILENPLKGKAKTILTWRWLYLSKNTDELDHTHSPTKQSLMENMTKDRKGRKRKPVRELFVKFEYHSYWDCEWIPELVLEVHQSLMHTFFKRKWDQDEPPALEDGSSYGRPRHKTASNAEEDDLEVNYYRYGIRPEWLQIHRIISYEKTGKEEKYLVKWRDLPYSDCTWEFPNELPARLEGWKKNVDAFWEHRRSKSDSSKKKEKKVPKKSLLKKKLEKQPEYIDSTGGTLHGYQLEGLNWMRFSWAQDTNIILADEMGLGKTIQAISILYTLWKEGYSPGPFLISAPLSTLPNWEREFEFWAPDMYVVTYTGGKENRVVIREREFSYKEGAFMTPNKPCKMKSDHKVKFDVILTSYEFVNMDSATLMSVNWSVLVIDEAHRLKNNQSLFFRTLSDYKLDYKLLLTGTPLQNNLEELFNLLNFLEPQKFDNMEAFLEEFSDISKDEQVSRLHQMLAPHMLRRMKADVLKDLPSKSETIVRVELSEMQKKFYKHILTKNYEALNVKGHSGQTSLMNIMMDLRKCCNHPYLFPTAQVDAPTTNRGLYEGNSLIKACGKMELLRKLLEKLKRDKHRVLIFSQMTRLLDLLEDFLEHCQYKYERIDGGVTGNIRQEAIDRFNNPTSEQFIFLLSTKAGGLGINLATADTVIIYDMDWNPHNDIQAFSRAHRIGQKNKVLIFRFVSRNTVEEKMAETCKKKMMLTELVIHRGMASNSGLIAEAGKKAESLTKQEINDILRTGAEKLFNDEEGKLVYDDATVEKMLDRSGAGDVDDPEQKDVGLNEYLRSFKVASYNVKEGDEDEEEEEEEKKEEETEEQAKYWQRILGASYNEYVVEQHRAEEIRIASMGKGKRIRKKINYAESRALEEQSVAKKTLDAARKNDIYLSDYNPSDDESSESEQDEPLEIVSGDEKKKRGRVSKGKASETFPPLVSKMNNLVEVLGFTPRQRRAFLDTVMRFGMPPDDPFRSQWLVRELRHKTEKVFKAYCALFLRHLCENVDDNALTYADGVPREGLSRRHVLTRIGMIALIRRKSLEVVSRYRDPQLRVTENLCDLRNVNQFESQNGAMSYASFRKSAFVDGETGEPMYLDKYEKNPPKIVYGTDNASKQHKSASDNTKKDSIVSNKPVQENGGVKKTINHSNKPVQENGVSEETKGENTKPGEQPDREMKKGKADGKESDANETEKPTKEDTNIADDEKAVKDDQGEKNKESTHEKMETESKDDSKDDEYNEADKSKEDDPSDDKAEDGPSDKTDKIESTETKASEDGDSDDVSSTGKADSKESDDGDSDDVSSKEDGKESVDDEDDDKEEKTDDSQDDDDDNDEDGSEKGGDDVEMEEKSEDSSDEDEVSNLDGTDDGKSKNKQTEKEDEESNEDSDSEEEKVKDEDMQSDRENDEKEDMADVKKKEEGETSVKESKGDTVDKKKVVEETEDVKMEVDDTQEEKKVDEESDKEDSMKKMEEDEDEDEVKNADKNVDKEENPDEEKDKEEMDENKGEEENSDVKKGKEDSSRGKEDAADKCKEESPVKSKEDSPRRRSKRIKKPPRLSDNKLRDYFWIADGGFTELTALWKFEERNMVLEEEDMTWHRRHDFWLLAGIVTHGYRHWQDILCDPRFSVLDDVFRQDGGVVRKAAFLNRRFQLLEQSLVIEEQLRKAVVENKLPIIANSPDPFAGTTKSLSRLDSVAEDMRRLNQGELPVNQPPSEALNRVWNQVSSVVQDVRQLGHTGTPPTLSVTQDDQAFPKFLAQQQALKAAAPKPASASPTPAATTTSPKKGRPTKEVICID